MHPVGYWLFICFFKGFLIDVLARPGAPQGDQPRPTLAVACRPGHQLGWPGEGLLEGRLEGPWEVGQGPLPARATGPRQGLECSMHWVHSAHCPARLVQQGLPSQHVYAGIVYPISSSPVRAGSTKKHSHGP